MKRELFTDVPDPDWVMIGIPCGNGVQLIASDSMTMAELRCEVELHGPDIFDDTFLPPVPSTRYFLTAEMRKFTLITARDYKSALEKLMFSWNPPRARRTPVTEGQREIT